MAQRIISDGVDGEVAPAQVSSEVGGEFDVIRMPGIGVEGVFTHGGDLDRMVVHDNGNRAVFFPGGQCLGKQLPHLIRGGIGGDVPILRFLAEQGIADGPTHDISLIAPSR